MQQHQQQPRQRWHQQVLRRGEPPKRQNQEKQRGHQQHHRHGKRNRAGRPQTQQPLPRKAPLAGQLAGWRRTAWTRQQEAKIRRCDRTAGGAARPPAGEASGESAGSRTPQQETREHKKGQQQQRQQQQKTLWGCHGGLHGVGSPAWRGRYAAASPREVRARQPRTPAAFCPRTNPNHLSGPLATRARRLRCVTPTRSVRRGEEKGGGKGGAKGEAAAGAAPIRPARRAPQGFPPDWHPHSAPPVFSWRIAASHGG